MYDVLLDNENYATACNVKNALVSFYHTSAWGNTDTEVAKKWAYKYIHRSNILTATKRILKEPEVVEEYSV
jgi:hypothetical protein